MDYDETISTLRYAGRAKNIRNQIYVNERPRETVLIRFQTEIEDLKKQLEMTGMTNEVKEQQDTPTKRKDRIKKNTKKKVENNEVSAV